MKYFDRFSFCSFLDYKARRLPLKNWITKPFWLRLRTNQSLAFLNANQLQSKVQQEGSWTNQSLAIVERQPIGVKFPGRFMDHSELSFFNLQPIGVNPPEREMDQ